MTDENGVPVSGVSISARGGSGYRGTTTRVDGKYAIALYADQQLTDLIINPNYSGLTSNDRIDLSLNGSDLNYTFVLPYVDASAPAIVVGPLATETTDTSAVIQWQTSEPANSSVAGSGFAAVSNPDYVVNHSLTVTGLSPSTTYTATVSSTDAAGNGPAQGSVTFTTLAEVDVDPPVIISGPLISEVTDTGAVVRWTTSEPAQTVLNWGAGSLGSVAQPDGVLRTEHEVALSGLSPLTNYSVQASATDAGGNGPTLSSVVDFKTLAAPDTEAPLIINGPFVTDITQTEATITWATNEPAVSGVSLNDGTQYYVYRDENLVTEHEVRVIGLNLATLYNYTVSSTDAQGNGPTLAGPDTFTTLDNADVDPPEITEGLKIVGITHQSAVIHWRTNEPADSVVIYGLTEGNLNLSTSDAKLQRKHVLQLTDLEPDTVYYLRGQSTDSAGNAATTAIGEFKTRSRPATTGPKFTTPPAVVNGSGTKALIRWETDEAAECSVTYQASGSSEEQRIDKKGMKTKHQALLSGLAEGTSYSYSVTCRNAAGVESTFDGSTNTASLFDEPLEWLYAAVNRVLFNQAIAQTSSGSFLVSAREDVAAPIVGVLTVEEASGSTLVLKVATDEPSTLEVRYGAGNLRQSTASTDYENEHIVVLGNLSPSTAYNVEVRARDIAGNVTTQQLNNQVTGSSADTTPPGLSSSPVIQRITDSEIRIDYATFEYATSSARCERTDTGARWTAGLEGLRRSHNLTLKGLDAEAAYNCFVKQTDVAGNSSEFGPYALAEPEPPEAPAQPTIADIEAGSESATITVSVGDNGGADITRYDAECTDGQGVVTGTSTTNRIVVEGLQNDVAYTCTVTATNSAGTSVASESSVQITPEFIPTGLPVWLLYEASKR